MSDRERARVLAIICASLILGVLYGLGGLSLYLRATYLQGTPTAPTTQNPTAVAPVDQHEAATPYPPLTSTEPAAGPAGGAAPTLYPTMTPRPGS